MTRLTLIQGGASGDASGRSAQASQEPDYSVVDKSIRHDPYMIEEMTYTLEEILRARALHPSSAAPATTLRSA